MKVVRSDTTPLEFRALAPGDPFVIMHPREGEAIHAAVPGTVDLKLDEPQWARLTSLNAVDLLDGLGVIIAPSQKVTPLRGHFQETVR